MVRNVIDLIKDFNGKYFLLMDWFIIWYLNNSEDIKQAVFKSQTIV